SVRLIRRQRRYSRWLRVEQGLRSLIVLVWLFAIPVAVAEAHQPVSDDTAPHRVVVGRPSIDTPPPVPMSFLEKVLDSARKTKRPASYAPLNRPAEWDRDGRIAEMRRRPLKGCFVFPRRGRGCSRSRRREG